MRLYYWSLSLFIGAENNLLLYMVVICINMHTALNLRMQPAPMRIPYPWGLFIIFYYFLQKSRLFKKRIFFSSLCTYYCTAAGLVHIKQIQNIYIRIYLFIHSNILISETTSYIIVHIYTISLIGIISRSDIIIYSLKSSRWKYIQHK